MAASAGSMAVTRPKAESNGTIPPVPQPMSRILSERLPRRVSSSTEARIRRRPTNHQWRLSWSSANDRYMEGSMRHSAGAVDAESGAESYHAGGTGNGGNAPGAGGGAPSGKPI